MSSGPTASWCRRRRRTPRRQPGRDRVVRARCVRCRRALDASSASSQRWAIRTRTPASAAASATASRKLRDHAVRLGGDADRFGLGDELERHPRAGVGLARAGRALDREDAVVERNDEPTRGVERRLAWPDERRAFGLHRRSRRAAEEQVASGAVRPGSVEPARRERGRRAARAPPRIGSGPYGIAGISASGWRQRRVPLQVDRAMQRVERDDLAGALPRRRVERVSRLRASFVSCAGSNR